VFAMMIDIEDIKRLSLDSRDILVVKVAKRVSQAQVSHMRELFSRIVDNKVLVMDDDIELFVLDRAN
jgi:hypothetical protein